MNPDSRWIAEFDQCRAAADESLDGLLKIAQRGSPSSTEVFLTALGAAAHLNAEGRGLLLAAAVTRLAQRGQP